MGTEVRHNPERSRYEILLDGQVVGITEYDTSDGALVFPHTVIEPALRGQGLGEQLVRGALDDVRRSGKGVIARCWFVREFIDGHPEYQELMRPSTSAAARSPDV